MSKIGNKGFMDACDFCYVPGKKIDYEAECPLIYCQYKHLNQFWVERRQIKGEYKLLTHGGDRHLTKELFEIFDCPDLVRWYGLNAVYEHDKIRAVPLGISDDHIRSAPSYSEIEKHRKSPKDKNGKILINFRTATNYEERAKYYKRELDDELFTVMRPDDYGDNRRYLEELSIHSYSICPSGKSVDTFRFWESLLLGTIPIVSTAYYKNNFKNIPHLIFDKIEDIIINGREIPQIDQKIFETKIYL